MKVALRLMPQEVREILYLRECKSCNSDDLGRRYGVSDVGAGGRLMRARRRRREILSRFSDVPVDPPTVFVA